MRLFKPALIIATLILCLALPALAFPEDNLSSRLSGKILIDVDNNGEAWYVYPGDLHRYYMGTPAAAYSLMRNLSLGISNNDFAQLASSTPDRFKGLILLKPEDVGKAYYVNPVDKSITYLANASSAFQLMRQSSLGITNQNLITIPVGKIILDGSGHESSRQWQYLGWWGVVNQTALVLAEPKKDATKLGTFYKTNKIKILAIKKGDGRIWYQVDGGQYPGGYVDSMSVSAIAQPAPEKNLVKPAAVKAGDYWIDVNLTKKVLTLYKDTTAILATYVAIGFIDTPTVTGTYNVWLKLKKTRMRGGPPISSHVYDLADVPWVMYYHGSFGVHGTYWHDDFGTQRSAGCTNVTQGDAKFLFDLTGPKIGDANSVTATAANPGVLINNHY